MRSKKNKETKKYAVGGVVAGLAGLGQIGLGAYQMIAGQQMAKGIKEASLKRPSEYAEMLKLSRQAELERRRLEEINRATATGIAAAQQAGGRAVIGALPSMVRAADLGAQDVLAARQAAQMEALSRAAIGSEYEIGREASRERQQQLAAQAAVEGGLQNIAGALGNIGTAAILGAKGSQEKEESSQPTAGMSKESMAIVSPAQSIERMAGQQAVTREAQRASLLRPERPLPMFADDQFKQYLDEQAGLSEMFIDRTSYLKDGGMMTGGKFSHKTNPIDIVQKGKKVGEMTGGEVILNPAQQKKLSKESAYFRSLLKKFNKQK